MVNHAKCPEVLANLRNEFTHRFTNFKAHNNVLLLFGDPFGIDLATVPETLQMVLVTFRMTVTGRMFANSITF